MKKTLDKTSDRNDFNWLCASDIMQRELISVRFSDTLEEVERTIADAQVSGVPVLGADDRVVGVLTTTDLVDRYAEGKVPDGMPVDSVDEDGNEVTLEYRSPEAARLCAGDVMTPEVESISPNADLRQVARRMVTSGVHRLLVTDGDRLVGIVSTIDVLRGVAGGPDVSAE